MDMENKRKIKNKKCSSLYKRALNVFRDAISINSDTESECDTRKQIKYGTKHQAARGLVKEYCDNTTIHGIRYMGEMKRPILERIFWTIAFCSSIFFCITLTMNVWDKWNNNPVILSFAEKSTDIWQIPFPSVTICPAIKTRSEEFSFSRMCLKLAQAKVNDITDKETYYMEAISQICSKPVLNEDEFSYKGSRYYVNGSELINAFEESSPHFFATFPFCNWPNIKSRNCKDFFRKIYTDNGLCYTFNAFDPRDIYRQEALVDGFVFDDDEHLNKTVEWNLEDGYSDKAEGPETYPYRLADIQIGLSLMLAGLEDNIDSLCSGDENLGFSIVVHAPGDLPNMSRQFINIPFDTKLKIQINAKVTTSTNGLKDYKPKRRRCYYQNEGNLRFFKLYTQSNCELECRSNFTLRKCGCVKFSLPRTADMPVCAAASMDCVNEVNEAWKRSVKNNFQSASDCNCLPTCSSIDYSADASEVEHDESIKTESDRHSRLIIFFKEDEFLTLKRSELYTTTDFFANCGGIFGLFMGVSTLSIVEIMYFCTVRLCINLRMRRKRRLENERLEKSNEEGFKAECNVTEKETKK